MCQIGKRENWVKVIDFRSVPWCNFGLCTVLLCNSCPHFAIFVISTPIFLSSCPTLQFIPTLQQRLSHFVVNYLFHFVVNYLGPLRNSAKLPCFVIRLVSLCNSCPLCITFPHFEISGPVCNKLCPTML